MSSNDSSTVGGESSNALQALSVVIYQQLHPNLLKNDLFLEGLLWNVDQIQRIEEDIAKSHVKLWTERLQHHRYGLLEFGNDEHLQQLDDSISKCVLQINNSLKRNEQSSLQFNDDNETKAASTNKKMSEAKRTKSKKPKTRYERNVEKEKFMQSESGSHHNKQQMQSTSLLSTNMDKKSDIENYGYYQEVTLLYRLLGLHTSLSQYWLLIIIYRQRKLLQDKFRDYILHLAQSRGSHHQLSKQQFASKAPMKVIYHCSLIETIGNLLEKLFLLFKLADSLLLALSTPIIGPLSVCSDSWHGLQSIVHYRLGKLLPQYFHDIRLRLEDVLGLVSCLLSHNHNSEMRSKTTRFQQSYHNCMSSLLRRVQPLVNFKYLSYFAKALSLHDRGNQQPWTQLFVLAGNILLQDQLNHNVSPWIRHWFFSHAFQMRYWCQLTYHAAQYCRMEATLKKLYDENESEEFMNSLSRVTIDNLSYFGEGDLTSLSEFQEIDLERIIQYPFHVFAKFNHFLVGVIGQSYQDESILSMLTITIQNQTFVSIASQMMLAMTDAVAAYRNILVLLKLKQRIGIRSPQPYQSFNLANNSDTKDMDGYELQERISIYFRILLIGIKQFIIFYEWIKLRENIFDNRLNNYHLGAAIGKFNDARETANVLMCCIPSSVLPDPNNDPSETVNHIEESQQANLRNDHVEYKNLKKHFTSDLIIGNTNAGQFLKAINNNNFATSSTASGFTDDQNINDPMNFPIRSIHNTNELDWPFDENMPLYDYENT